MGGVGKGCTLALALAMLLIAADGQAGSSNIRRTLRNAPGLVGLTLDERYRNAADVLVESAARNLPIPASLGSFTYRYDAASDRYERSSETLGPTLFMERPQTIGRGMWNVGGVVQYLELDEFDGRKVGKDPDPLITPSGDVTTFSATPKPLYHLFTLNVTYGVTDDLDINVAVPLAAVDFDTNTSRQDAGSTFVSRVTEHGHVSLGVADILLRAKYQLCNRTGWAAAAGFITRLPTGDRDKALGTGDAELGPYLAFSWLLWNRVEPTWNAGFDANVSDPHLSSAHYAFGVNVQTTSWLDLGGSLHGRSEVDGRRAETSVSGPHQTPTGTELRPYLGVSVDRNDYFDAAFGGRIRLGRTVVLALNAVYALNEDGLRASDFSPVASLEGTF
jgi:hypothetical protein